MKENIADPWDLNRTPTYGDARKHEVKRVNPLFEKRAWWQDSVSAIIEQTNWIVLTLDSFLQVCWMVQVHPVGETEGGAADEAEGPPSSLQHSGQADRSDS